MLSRYWEGLEGRFAASSTREIPKRPLAAIFGGALAIAALTTMTKSPSVTMALAERQVTIDNVCHPLPPTFFVIATQDPLDSHGAYPLPEAQLDRFAMKLNVGYPDRASELRMLAADFADYRAAESGSKAVLEPHELEELQRHVAGVAVSEKVREYLMDLVAETRRQQDMPGISPRGLRIIDLETRRSSEGSPPGTRFRHSG